MHFKEPSNISPPTGSKITSVLAVNKCLNDNHDYKIWKKNGLIVYFVPAPFFFVKPNTELNHSGLEL